MFLIFPSSTFGAFSIKLHSIAVAILEFSFFFFSPKSKWRKEIAPVEKNVKPSILVNILFLEFCFSDSNEFLAPALVCRRFFLLLLPIFQVNAIICAKQWIYYKKNWISDTCISVYVCVCLTLFFSFLFLLLLFQ